MLIPVAQTLQFVRIYITIMAQCRRNFDDTSTPNMYGQFSALPSVGIMWQVVAGTEVTQMKSHAIITANRLTLNSSKERKYHFCELLIS